MQQLARYSSVTAEFRWTRRVQVVISTARPFTGFLSHTAALHGPHLLPAAYTLLAVELQAQTLVTRYATSGGGAARS